MSFGATTVRNDSDEDAWRRCRTPSPDFTHRLWKNFAESLDRSDASGRSRTPSPYSTQRLWEHVGEGEAPSATKGVAAVAPPFVMMCAPFAQIPFLGSAKFESISGGITPSTTSAQSWSELPLITGQSDDEEKQSRASVTSTEGSPLTEHANPQYPYFEETLPCSSSIFPVSTFGHAYPCGKGCKYFSKKRGCKDGDACSHCHVCPWDAGTRRKTRSGRSKHLRISSDVA